MSRRAMVVVLNNYPYSFKEPFFETEIKYLKDVFDKIIIVSHNISDEKVRDVPNNCSVYRFNKFFTARQLLKYWYLIFTMDFLKEIKTILKVYKLKIKKSIIKDLIVSVIRAKRLYKFIKNVCGEQKIFDKFEEILFYSYWYDHIPYALLPFKKMSSKYKVITRVHGRDFVFERTNDNYLPLKKVIYDKIDRIVFASEYAKDYICKKLRVSTNEKFIVSRLGVDNNRNVDIKSTDGILRLLSVSNVVKFKDVYRIAEALKNIDDIKVHWTHIGHGDLFEELKIKCMALNEQENITYELKGQLANSEVMEFYLNNPVDLFVTLTQTEGGVPVSIQEACSYHILILATNVGGVPEIVSEDNGFLLSANPTNNEIIEKIRKFMSLDDECIESMRKNSRTKFEAGFTGCNNYKQFIDVITSLF